MIERVCTTIYFVDDWAASVAFYRDVLGLKPLFIEHGFAQFEVGQGGGLIAIHARGAHEHGHEATHVSLEVQDIDGTLRALTARGARVVREVQRQDFGALAAVADPSGNVIGLYEPKHPAA